MTAIQVRKTAEEPGATSLAVTVPVEQVQEAEARATSVYQRRAPLPGFRKGKAPAALLKRQFAEDIRQQTLEELIRESWKNRKSTRLNSSHGYISYAVFCFHKKKTMAHELADPSLLL